MSWESTAGYYQAINEGVKARLGGLHSAQIAMVSVDFEPIEQLQHQGDWAAAAAILCDAAKRVEQAGADFLLICTNTMHKLAPEISGAVRIPLLHIADATAETLVEHGCNRVGLLGTAFTMEQDFYTGRLREQFGLDVLVPDAEDRALVHRVIYDELCQGLIEPESKSAYLKVVAKLAEQGAEAVILGCTEIGLLIQQADTEVRLVDTTAIHSQRAVDLALS
jgi:aspartate racemase